MACRPDRSASNGVPPAGRKSNSVAEGHGQQILSVLQSFREQSVFFDFTINVKDEVLPCHRCVLAASSDFFRAMFEVNMKERDGGSVTISNLSPETVKAFLDYAYTGKVEITDSNVDMYFQMSSFLQARLLAKACSDFLIKTIDVHNCLQLLSIADSYGCTRLFHRALQFTLEHFSSLTQSLDFLELNMGVLEQCLQSEEINVPDEEFVLTSLLSWTKHCLEKRERFLPELMDKVRLHQLSLSALKKLLVSEEQLLKSTNCLSKIHSAIQRVEQSGGRFSDTRISTTANYIFVHKSEGDGEIQYSFCYNIKQDKWMELSYVSMMDSPGSCLSSYGDKILITGGCAGNCCQALRLHVTQPYHQACDQTWSYCPIANSTELVKPMSKRRTMHASLMVLDQLFVIGGKTKGSRDIRSLLDVEAYNPLTDNWKTVASLPRGIYYPEASACKSDIYVLGSEVEITDAFNPSLDCFFKYNAETDQWSELVVESGPFFHATLIKAVSVNNTLYICDLSTYKVYSFCPDTCVWKGEGSFECAGFNAGAVGIDDKIYLLGGDYAPDEITDEVQVYHSNRSEWEEVSPMPRALTEFYCEVLQFQKCNDAFGMIFLERAQRVS